MFNLAKPTSFFLQLQISSHQLVTETSSWNNFWQNEIFSVCYWNSFGKFYI